jgi:hypothetical protein
MSELLGWLASARRSHTEAQAAVDAAAEAWKRDNAELLDTAYAALEFVRFLEQQVRDLTLRRYAETGSKKPAPCVGVRIMKRIDYDADAALDWAKAHQVALSLDRKVFEKVAPVACPELVTITEDPLATIAADLSEYLATKED